MSGPPPKPTAALRLAGSWRAKTRKGEPQLPLDTPMPPPWLGDDARAAWDEVMAAVMPMRVLTRSDGIVVAQLAEYLARWKKATAAIAKFGDVMPIKDENGQVRGLKRSPYVAMQIEYGMMLHRFMSEFGMSPASRSRLTQQNEQPNTEALFSRARKSG